MAATLQEKDKEYDEVISKWKKKLLDAKDNLGDERDKCRVNYIQSMKN